jgi:UDP-N-acetylglucosamine:LPS N-acetylglucosamine transferase
MILATAAIPVIASLSQKNAKQLEKDGAVAYFEQSTLMLDKASESLLAAVKKVLIQPVRARGQSYVASSEPP